jgi:acetyl-CoA hydrolase
MSQIGEISPAEAAESIQNGETIGCSGFTAAGSIKKISVELAKKAVRLHERGEEFRVRLFTGASTGDSLDGQLARADAVSMRMPYQSNPSMREAANLGRSGYVDHHLSHFPQQLAYGFFGEVDWALVEVCDFNDAGELVLTSSVGCVPTFCRMAKKILLEHNAYHPQALRGIHDIYVPHNPPHRSPIPLTKVSDRIGAEVVRVDPSKIVGVVASDSPDEVKDFKESSDVHGRIGRHVAEFLARELREGRIPSSFLPIQSGVGNIANAVLKAVGENSSIPPCQMYSEVAQNAVIELMQSGRITFASATSLTVTPELSRQIYDNLNFFRDKIVLRPYEITNHPELIRRIGLISINTGLEADIFGNVNSTYLFGNMIMNGIGGSGDFTRNAYISIFTLPSVAKDGKISSIVPFCTHIDHTNHDVQVIVTEQGIADLRGKSPMDRARMIVDNCAHPDYRPILHRYLEKQTKGHTPNTLADAFRMHQNFQEFGDMRA